MTDTDTNGWRDIETAPKDGTRILVAVSHHGWVGEVSWWDAWYSNKNNQGWMFANCDEEYGSYIEATHWQPLPAPPQKQEG